MNPIKRNSRSKSPQNLFKDFNKSKLQRLSNTFGRNSIDEMEREMEKKFRAIRLNKYKPRKFDNNYQKILIACITLLLIITLISFLSLFQKNKQTVYCSEGIIDKQNCEPCPFSTECYQGKIVQCPIGTFLQNDECISVEKIELLKKKMKDYLKNILQYSKGDALCYKDENLAKFKFQQIENILGDKFRGDQYYEDAVRELVFDLKYDSKYQNIFESIYDRQSSYDQLLSAKEPKFRLVCSIMMIYQQYKWLYFTIIICIFFMGFMYLKAHFNKKYVQIAERIYKENLQKFNEGTEEINTNQLLFKDKDELTPSQRNTVMKILEEIRVKDEQIGEIQKYGEIYWVKF